MSSEVFFAVEQTWTGLDVLRGAGVDNIKSSELCAVSMHPWSPRAMASVLLGAGAAAEPSKQLAVVP